MYGAFCRTKKFIAWSNIPMATLPKKPSKKNGGFAPGFENYFPEQVIEGKTYISVVPEALELVDSKYCSCKPEHQKLGAAPDVDPWCITCNKDLFPNK